MAAGLRQRRRPARPVRTALIARRRLLDPARSGHAQVRACLCVQALQGLAEAYEIDLRHGRKDAAGSVVLGPPSGDRKQPVQVPADGVWRCRAEASGHLLALLRGSALPPDLSAGPPDSCLHSTTHTVRYLSHGITASNQDLHGPRQRVHSGRCGGRARRRRDTNDLQARRIRGCRRPVPSDYRVAGLSGIRCPQLPLDDVLHNATYLHFQIQIEAPLTAKP